MTQLTLHIDTDAPDVDKNGYPLGFFDSIAADISLWDDFPSQDQIRSGMGQDLPRESI